MQDLEPRTIAIYSDIGCPWSHLAVYRLHRARAQADLDDVLRFDHRAFPLELFNNRPTPRILLDAEIAVVGGRDPGAGWSLWKAPPDHYPVTMLPALEAVQATKEQDLRLSEELDLKLRIAFFRESRTISLRHEILDVAATVEGLDVDRLADALDAGAARRRVLDQKRAAEEGPIEGSPHLVLPDGTTFHNPGIELEWQGEELGGFPIVKRDDPSIYDDIVRRAAA